MLFFVGTCNEVYRGAVHTRFEHSCGVCHLADEQVRKIRDTQEELDITNSDIMCVNVAAICHDIGHGPYSHVYDGVFLKRMYPDGVPIDENDGNKKSNDKTDAK